MTEIGIANIETVVGFVCGVGVDAEAALADGKFNIPGDLIRFLDDGMKIPGLVKALPEVPNEFLNMTPEKNAAIIEFVKAKLNLPQADVTEVVAAAIDATLSSSATVNKVKILIEKIKALKHPAVVKKPVTPVIPTVVPPKK